jgi:hypothetical protein
MLVTTPSTNCKILKAMPLKQRRHRCLRHVLLKELARLPSVRIIDFLQDFDMLNCNPQVLQNVLQAQVKRRRS